MRKGASVNAANDEPKPHTCSNRAVLRDVSSETHGFCLGERAPKQMLTNGSKQGSLSAVGDPVRTEIAEVVGALPPGELGSRLD